MTFQWLNWWPFNDRSVTFQWAFSDLSMSFCDILLIFSWPFVDLFFYLLLTFCWPFDDLSATFQWPFGDLSVTFWWPFFGLSVVFQRLDSGWTLQDGRTRISHPMQGEHLGVPGSMKNWESYSSYLSTSLVSHNIETQVPWKKIPHTGDTESLNRWGS